MNQPALITTPAPPAESRHFIDLPLTRLHYVECGAGEPLIMVPATISRIDDWLPFVQFVGQRFHAHFFELPGQGGSTPFAKPFSSDQVAEAVEQFADAMGFEKFALMGFSFGGILTLKALQRLGDRVTKVVLLSPFVCRSGLKHNPVKLRAVRAAAASAGHSLGRSAWLKIMRDPYFVDAFVWFATFVGKYETSADLRARLLQFSDSAFDTLRNQVVELLSIRDAELSGPYTQPCFFAMSVHDPLLDFDTSYRFVMSQFTDPIVQMLDFPYHAPPEPFSFAQLNHDYRPLLSAFGEE